MKKIWFEIKRFDVAKDLDVLPPSTIQCVSFDEDSSSVDSNLKHTVMSTFDIPQDGSIVMKVRNHRGSLLPLCNRLAANTKLAPYKLEVFRQFQSFGPTKTATAKPRDIENTDKKIKDLVHRLDVLEATVPDLSERRTAKLSEEIKNCELKLVFLEKRIQDAEGTKWEGMFKRNPLW